VKPDVLILDDHESYRRLLRPAAESKGFKVLPSAPTTGAALQVCARTRPKVIILDLRIDPDDDGYSFCNLLREINGPTTQIVVTSSFEGRDNVDRAFRAGADRCLRKPYRRDDALRLFERLASELAPVAV
jgi:CheY-like chemotaxis protein